MPKKKTQTTKVVSTPGAPASQQQIGNYVRQLRCERKWTQWQLAQISRLSERTIQRIENGHRMGITAELALAGAFEIEISAFIPVPLQARATNEHLTHLKTSAFSRG